ncbi:penicillin-binding protein 2 [Kibdelosporangium philippinense]|uniref:Penicillin-binding protein 2 n=1 Tax=Kibdelosporangium philippinense TaxID=211113 RepID=A0ABS8ZI39_9PSEU|nr:penicillin-binding protein 2 [Kibdelosporangium philippinense]MCE7007474.1 penicillin-binding protein 2 [Kibdelosporangium philippinense]
MERDEWIPPSVRKQQQSYPKRKPPQGKSAQSKWTQGKSSQGKASSKGKPPTNHRPSAKPARPPARKPPAKRAPMLRRKRVASNPRLRIVTVRFVLIAALIAAGVRLVQVQGLEAEALTTRANKQRATTIPIPAKRGDIIDRNGMKLAFSVETRALAWSPQVVRKDYEKNKIDYDTRVKEIAAKIKAVLGDKVDENELLTKMMSDKYSTLARDVLPAQERQIRKQYREVISETQSRRDYPGGTVASNILGYANWRSDDKDPAKHNVHGLFGMENDRDAELAGEPGRQTVDTAEGADGVVIPGTERNVQQAKDGSDIELTIDADVQYDVQQKLAAYVAAQGAKGGSVIVMDAHTSEVYALANDKSFDPANPKGPNGYGNPQATGNPAVTTPYEPGSVNKIVTAAAAIEDGLTKPEDTQRVLDTHKVADRTIKDGWDHGPLNMTTTGIFAKSSNVGTLMLAERVGQDRYAEMLKKFGLGQRTGIGLPGESPGSVPERKQWSGSTFGNLPIGQGLSMTVLQMAGTYQTIANNGVRVPPRIIKSTIDRDGTRHVEPRPEGIRVVSEQTAITVRNMFRATMQKAPGNQTGTGVPAALNGFQISGKTGTGQQIDPLTGKYSESLHTITFAGILPADSPRFVVGILIDRPDYFGAPNGKTAAPLFHDIASYLAQRFNLPLSPEPSPVVPLTVG